MKTKAVFFDLDGTLLDSLGDLTDSVNYSLNQHHFALRTLNEIRSYLGHGSKYLIEHAIGKEVSEEVFQSVFNTYLNKYIKECTIKSKPYDGVIELFDCLKENDIKIGLITNKPELPTNNIISAFFNNYFSVVYSLRKDIKKKPDPESIWLAINDLKLKREDVLYVGDSLVDKETADNAGVRYVLVSYGYVDKEILEAAKATNIVDTILEIKEFL